jgi:hypothetical protein
MVLLPVELIHEILSALTAPSNDYQFSHWDVDITITLRHLCLANRRMNGVCTPYLYSHITIACPRQFRALMASLPLRHFALTHHPRALWISCFPGAINVLPHLLCLIGHKLRLLSICDITPLLLVTSSHARDIMQQHCMNLEVFCYIQGEVEEENEAEDNMDTLYSYQATVIHSIPQQQSHLVLENIHVNDTFVDKIQWMHTLSRLVLVNAYWDSPDGDTTMLSRLLFPDTNYANRRLQNVHLILNTVCGAWYDSTSATDQVFLKRLRDISTIAQISEGGSGFTQLQYTLVVGYEERQTMEYIEDMIFMGKVWELEGSEMVFLDEKGRRML